MAKDKDEWVRMGAAEAFGSLGWTGKEEFDKQIIEKLIELAKDEVYSVRESAAKAFGFLGWTRKEEFDKKIFEFFKDELKEEDYDFLYAFISLGLPKVDSLKKEYFKIIENLDEDLKVRASEYFAYYLPVNPKRNKLPIFYDVKNKEYKKRN